jgi:hypothetical protein
LATIRQTRNFQHGPGLPVHQQRVHRCTRALRDHDQHGWQEPAPAKAGGRYMDNIFVARLWRSLKYEEVYLHAYGAVADAKAGIGAWLTFYNDERQHQEPRLPHAAANLPGRPVDMWTIGVADRLRFPRSRASSEGGEMLAFAHIPTGTAQLKVENDFWHESSANEPSATSRAGRARGRSAAGITLVPVAGGVALFALSPTGRGQRGGARHHGIDRPAIFGPALLRLAPDGGVAGDPRPCGQSQTGPAPDAVNGAGGDLPACEHEQASRGAQNLPVLAWRHHGQSGLVFGRHLHPNSQGLPLSGGRHGLGEPCRAGVAIVEHPRCRVLCRGARGSTHALRPVRDLQYRPEPALAKAGAASSPTTTSPAP